MKTVAIIGRSTPPFDAFVAQSCHALGRLVAERGFVLLSGACPGYPHAAVQSAFLAGGRTVGYSPGADAKHHVDVFSSPVDALSEIRYFGDAQWSAVKNFTWRSAHLIDEADAVISIDGSWGTLSEIALVFETEKPFGVLESGGASGFVRALEAALARRRQRPVIYHSDAAALADAVLVDL